MRPQASREQLIAKLASVIGDYQNRWGGTGVEDHIDRWVSQFPDEVQETLLDELVHVFSKTYFSQTRVEGFFERVLKRGSVISGAPSEFWRRVGYLDIQDRGTSQKELLQLFSQVLERSHGYSVHETQPRGNTFIYIDDGIYTGNRFKKLL